MVLINTNKMRFVLGYSDKDNSELSINVYSNDYKTHNAGIIFYQSGGITYWTKSTYRWHINPSS